MNNSIDFWFPTAIYKELCNDIDNQYLEKVAYDLYNKFDQSNKLSDWRCNTFNTLGITDLIQAQLLPDAFFDRMKKSVYSFSLKFGIDLPVDRLKIKDCWFNLSKPGNYQEYHQHSEAHFSLVYYVKVPSNSGNIVFRSFESLTDMYRLPTKQMNEFSYKTCSYTPVESMMLIFRSNVLHMVEENLSDQDRISIAMNFNF